MAFFILLNQSIHFDYLINYLIIYDFFELFDLFDLFDSFDLFDLFDLFDPVEFVTGRAANFLMENGMESASLENERLGTKLNECQVALEALVREGQAKDCRITQLQATVSVTKSDLSEIMRKHKIVRRALKTLKESHATLIEGINVLTDNFDPVTGGPLFNAAETLDWLTLTGGVRRDIKQEHRRQICTWIRAAAQDDEDEEDKDVDGK